MRSATIKMKKIINDQKLESPKYRVVSNVTAEEYENIDEIKQLLIKQIEKPSQMERKCRIYDFQRN